MSQTVPPRKAGGSRGRPNLALFEARLRAGLSRAALGELAGISEKQVGLIERGVAKHSRAETLAGLAAGVGLDVTDCFDLPRLMTSKRNQRKAP